MNIHLTKREIEVCALMLLCLSYREIGIRLSMSHRTAEDHSLNIQKKFKVHSYQQLLCKLWELAK